MLQIHFLYHYLIHCKTDAEVRKDHFFPEKCCYDTKNHIGFICTPGESSRMQKMELKFSMLPLRCQGHKDSSVTTVCPVLLLACPLL